MHTKEKKRKDPRGGVRVPGPGKKLGAPKVLKDYITIRISLDTPTMNVLDNICPGNRSKAIRILAGTDTP